MDGLERYTSSQIVNPCMRTCMSVYTYEPIILYPNKPYAQGTTSNAVPHACSCKVLCRYDANNNQLGKMRNVNEVAVTFMSAGRHECTQMRAMKCNFCLAGL